MSQAASIACVFRLRAHVAGRTPPGAAASQHALSTCQIVCCRADPCGLQAHASADILSPTAMLYLQSGCVSGRCASQACLLLAVGVVAGRSEGAMLAQYVALRYSGTPFSLFSVTHLSGIAAVLATCLLLIGVLRSARLTPVWRSRIRHGLSLFAILNLVAWYTWEWNVGLSSWSYSLPLQICTFATILCPLMLWSRSVRLFEVVYFWGFAGATQALITPDVAPFDFPHFVFIIFFTSHGCILLCAIFMLVAEGYRPYWSSLARVIALTLGFLSLAALANVITGGDYMFVASKPPFPTLMDYLGPWPWYVGWLIL